jgi:peptide/nickel transport system ATP-binding protein
MRHIRGRKIGAIFKDPLTSLNPLYTIGRQLTETIRTHLPVSEGEARRRAIGLLQDTGIPGAEQRIDHYPHQFSGGMRQRVVIALALAAEPKLIVADEPTTALDVSIQAQIIRLLKRICKERGAAVMLITHDMGVIAETCDRVAVMYAGRINQIDGAMPRLNAIPRGCAYNPRCPRVFDRCLVERPDLLNAGATRAACWLHDARSSASIDGIAA